jgi:hypothetical protein
MITNDYSRRLLRVANRLLPFLAFVAVGEVCWGGLCGTPNAVGKWKNQDQATRGITRAVFRMECRDDTKTTCVGSICRTTFGVKAHYFLKIYGKCTPTDCNWGEVEGNRLPYTDWYYFYFNQGFAGQHVFVNAANRDSLYIYVLTDFVDRSRRDYESSYSFVRQ